MRIRSVVLPALLAMPLLGAPAVAKMMKGDVTANLATQSLDGKALFHEKCAMCHEPNGMGTALLARRTKPAELTKRTDLTKDFVIQVARTGLGNMPAISRGEVSDPQLEAIAAYLHKAPEAKK
ncbi:MAG TPA: cytochrome c [Alphaproteobacteria bacterium]|nr:cytochrome c [Alphaproteobacteria bacterium]